MDELINKLAEQLQAMKPQYPLQIPDDIVQKMRQSGIVVAFGESDDSISLEGAICDQAYAYGDEIIYIDSTGILPISENGEIDSCYVPQWINDAIELVQRYEHAIKIKVIQHEGWYSWQYELTTKEGEPIPHATFDILEDNDFYCKAIVFKVPEVEAESKPVTVNIENFSF